MRTSFKIFFVIVFGLSVTGCKKALEIDPSQSIDAATALTTKDNVNAAITGVYSRLKSARLYGRDLIALPEALSDNGFATNKSGRLLPEANNTSGAHFTTTLWQQSYFAINEINLILSKIQSVSDATSADKTNWEGQLLFLRALYHFNLMNAYAYMPGATVPAQDLGGVPILLTYTNNIDTARIILPARAPIDAVYAQIVSDLQTANSRFGTSFTFNDANVSMANKPAILGLLSRVNLYRKNYSEAKRWSDSCITYYGSRLRNASQYVNSWRQATHDETLFQIRFASTSENIGVNESLQTSFTTLVTPGGTITGGFGDLVPTLSLLSDLGITIGTVNTTTGVVTPAHNTTSFSSANLVIASRSSDVRNQLYEVGTSGRGLRKVETTKYLGKNGAINLDNVPVIRIAEIYLNRAEAYATPGSPVFDEASALTDLNTILVNRGLPTVTLSGTALYDEILKQRRVELAFEGHRFFDLKRLGRNIVKGPHYNDVAFTDFRILAPIPQREVDGNPNLKQNFGY
jgi:starch-binding outer membrane protein, SusD/RagB family